MGMLITVIELYSSVEGLGLRSEGEEAERDFAIAYKPGDMGVVRERGWLS